MIKAYWDGRVKLGGEGNLSTLCTHPLPENKGLTPVVVATLDDLQKLWQQARAGDGDGDYFYDDVEEYIGTLGIELE